MILSASRRTDIPACYSQWFMNRLQAGFLLTRNPFNAAQVRRVGLSREEIDCIVLWTKDPAPMLPALDALDAFGCPYYFQFTLTPYDARIERNLRPKEDIVKTFVTLGKRLGRSRVFWRYDPVIVNDTFSVEDHFRAFTALCARLCDSTESVTISFVDVYRKLKTPLIREVTQDEIAQISAAFSRTAGEHGLSIRACCEQTGLSSYGIRPASCIDLETIERLCGRRIAAGPDKNQRPGCGCVASVDIGAYNTCKNGCVYCYATANTAAASTRYARHDPAGEFLA